MVEAIGHADGDLDPVVGRLEPGVGVAQLDGPEDVGPAPANLPGEFRDLGDAARLPRSLRKKTQLLNARPVPPISRWESIEVGA